MDFTYTFHQAHQDRLEDAGIIQYRPTDGFRFLGQIRHNPPRSTHQRQRLMFATILNSISK